MSMGIKIYLGEPVVVGIPIRLIKGDEAKELCILILPIACLDEVSVYPNGKRGVTL